MNDSKDPDRRQHGGLALAIASLLLVVLIGGAVIWILLGGEDLPRPPETVTAISDMPAPPPQPETPADESQPAPPTVDTEPVVAEAPRPIPEVDVEPAPTTVESPESPSAEPPPPPEPDTQTAQAQIRPGVLKPAPDPALTEPGRHGLLPRISPDGRLAWRVYARPFDTTDGRPRIAIVLGNLGISDAATETAIQQLPGGITLAFSPYAGRSIE